jgi:parallel beta-helix repeat protein
MRFLRGASIGVCVLLAAAALQAQSSLTRPYSALIVTPHGGAVASGASEQFSAIGIGDADVTWTATGGTITPTGLFIAGSNTGVYSVTATVGERSMTVAVTVTPASAQRAPSPVTIRPGDSIQDAVRNSPPGTTFLIRRGVHRRQTVQPKEGMSFIGEPGAVLDGENATAQAFLARNARDVTVRGLHITRYAPPGSGAAIEGHGSEKWTVEGNEIDGNVNGGERAYGVRVGTGWILRRNSIHHNGWVGVQGYECFDSLIEANDIYANPPANFDDTVGEAANIKLFECGRIVIRGNYVHDGFFRGIWVDTMAPDVTIEHNRVVNHGRAGIWYEVSYRGTIRNNYVENAGYAQTPLSNWLRGGGIEVSNSPDVSVVDNAVVNSLNGIIGLQAEAYSDGPYGKSQLRNFLVQGNTIVMPRGQTGITQNIGNNDVFTRWNNRFFDNRYELLSNKTPFAWMGRQLDERQWQEYGQGTNDVFTR